MAPTRPNSLLLGLIVGSVLVGVYDALFYWRGLEPASVVSALWPYAFAVLLVLWLEQDSRTRPAIYRPFEFSY